LTINAPPIGRSSVLDRIRSVPIRPAWFGVAALALITTYYVAEGSAFHLFILNACLLAVIGAIALNLLMGTAGLVSIGNSAFLAVGAFSAVFAIKSGVPFPGDLVVGALAAAAAGAVIGLPALRLRGLYLALATLAGFFIVQYFATLYQSRGKGGGSGGFYVPVLFQDQGYTGGQQYWAWTLLVIVSVLVLIATRLGAERSGRAWRLIRDHEIVAHTMGIPVTRYKMIAFALSSALIGFQGALAAHLSGSVSVDQYTLALAIAYIAMVLIGGLDSVLGAVIGAFVVTALPTVMPVLMTSVLGRLPIASQGPAVAEILYGLLVIIFIVSSQQGIVGLLRNIIRRSRLLSAGARRIEGAARRSA
jgi:branched-chain amino acid transport system permease protein